MGSLPLLSSCVVAAGLITSDVGGSAPRDFTPAPPHEASALPPPLEPRRAPRGSTWRLGPLDTKHWHRVQDSKDRFSFLIPPSFARTPAMGMDSEVRIW